MFFPSFSRSTTPTKNPIFLVCRCVDGDFGKLLISRYCCVPATHQKYVTFSVVWSFHQLGKLLGFVNTYVAGSWFSTSNTCSKSIKILESWELTQFSSIVMLDSEKYFPYMEILWFNKDFPLLETFFFNTNSSLISQIKVLKNLGYGPLAIPPPTFRADV